MMKYLHQKGDTIVEVIIAMAVLSLVLGGAYASSRRSLNATIQAHEHSTALKIAEAQQEKLKYLSNTSSAIYAYTVGVAFCVKDDLTTTYPTADHALQASSANVFSDYITSPATCIKTNGINYYVAIGRSADKVFTVYVRWNNIHGTGQDQVTLAYKLDK